MRNRKKHNNSPVCVLESKNVLVVSTVMVPMVPSVICAQESLLPRYLPLSSLCELCLLKFLHRIISSVVLCLRNPRAMRISSVVDCRLMAGRCSCGGGGTALLHGLGSRLELQLLESGDLGCPGMGVRFPPAIELDCLLRRPRLLRATGLRSLSVLRSGLKCVLESRLLRDAESGLKLSLLALRPDSSTSGLNVG